MANHLPLIGRRAPNHAAWNDSADPHWPITCPTCRAMLENKVAVHTKTAMAAHSKQDRAFFLADAAHWQSVLNRAL